jgi:hypothetical protein
VERHPLDDAGEHLAVGLRSGRWHGMGRIIPHRSRSGEQRPRWQWHACCPHEAFVPARACPSERPAEGK